MKICAGTRCRQALAMVVGGAVSVARNDGLAGSLDGLGGTTAPAKYATGIGRFSVGLAAGSDHTVGEHGVVLHGKRGGA